MLKLPIIALFLRTIPEGILVIFSSYIIARETLNRQKIISAGVLFGVITYLTRLLPLNFGVHTIIILMSCILILNKLNHFYYFKAVTSSIITFVIISFSDWINVVFLINIMKVPVEDLINRSLKSVLIGLPSLAFAVIIIWFIYSVRNKKLTKGI